MELTCIVRSGSVQQLGGKGFALSRLELAGLRIPKWFAVSPETFVRMLTSEQRAALSSGDASGVRRALCNLRVAPDLAGELRQAVAALGGDRFAVRSSAVEEDGAQDSFAGQLASYLFVSADDVARRVADVWRSGFSEQIAAYRTQRGITAAVSAPAVLVQRMIDADCAGVAFSADPVSGRRGLAIVSAVFGLGTALVGGEAEADLYAVDRTGIIERRAIAHKEFRHEFSSQVNEGVEKTWLAEELRDRAVLSDEQAIAVAALTRKAAAHSGRPQDIEWAIEGDKLYLLQSRPITTLCNVPDPEGVLNIWDNSNIIESYSGVTTPLTFSFARYIYEGVYRQFCRILRVPERKIAVSERTFAKMLGLIQGRVYYNLLNWYRVLALLPGFTFNRRFMEQMMGVRESLPGEIAAGRSVASRRERLEDVLSLAGMLLALTGNLMTLERKIAEFEVRLNVALRDPSPALGEMRLDELAAYYTQLQEKLLTRWDAPLINDFFAMIFHGALCKLTLKWLRDEGGTLANDAIRGQGGMISAEPAERVRALAAIGRADAEFVRCLCEDSVDDCLRAVAAHAEFRTAYEEYLCVFGDRCMEELKLESETLRDNPMVLLRSVGQLAAAGVERERTTNPFSAAKAAEKRIRTELSGSPLRRAALLWVLRHARRRVQQRENLRFERTRLFGRVRQIFRECGKRLCELGVLASAEDVFYLQVEEILGFVNGTSVTVDVAAMAALRKAEFTRYRAMPAPPDRFETRGAVDVAQSFIAGAARTAAESAVGDERQGIGCCPGVVRGEVKVIRDPRHAQLPAGRILVAEHTDPGWIMLFPSAIGVLVERGSLLSHSAIVARELGIPAVVSVRGLTGWLQDGDLVELDGARGLVRKISAGEAHAK
jgi:pyruvate,water dikinase